MTRTAPVAYVRLMARCLGALLVAAAVLASVACGTQHAAQRDPSVHVAPDLPPAAATWPPYPHFSDASCWTRPFGGGTPLRAAPSVPVAAPPSHLAAAMIVARLLARFRDNRYVRSVALGPPPPITLQHLRGYFAGARPPADALWAYVSVPAANQVFTTEHPNPRDAEAQMVAEWEAGLVVGALRDDFCAAGGAPLVGWSTGKGMIGLSDRTQALEQRFPNPSTAAFRNRVQVIGRRYGFTVEELRLLRPRQLAPLLIVHTSRDRKAFVGDVAAIMKLLDPVNNHGRQAAVTFEGFFFEAIDDKGPFVRVENHYRGQTEGGQWSWNRCVYPYFHSEPVGAKPCP